ncbi:MAG: pyridoxamine 5'-phosphate oxidase family protein [SAR324 cluster bacterium]|nr:pyridoxamine 5'-phosphate oxidase family protein [SAR324 cluster bacterium]
MRRKEFLITTVKLQNKILQDCHYGTLAMISEGMTPYQVPLNYAYFEGKIYFHSALVGKKIKSLEINPNVHFNIVEPLSLIPSFFTDPTKSCNATQFFLSLSMGGVVKFVGEPELKIKVLDSMMRHLQPEGNFPEITEKQVKAMTLFELDPREITGKFKAGQNLTPEVFQGLVASLEARGTELDLKTCFWMKELYPDA